MYTHLYDYSCSTDHKNMYLVDLTPNTSTNSLLQVVYSMSLTFNRGCIGKCSYFRSSELFHDICQLLEFCCCGFSLSSLKVAWNHWKQTSKYDFLPAVSQQLGTASRELLHKITTLAGGGTCFTFQKRVFVICGVSLKSDNTAQESGISLGNFQPTSSSGTKFFLNHVVKQSVID